MVEQPAVNRQVLGSSPSPAVGQVAERLNALVLKTGEP